MERVEVITKLREFSLQGFNKLREFFDRGHADDLAFIEDELNLIKQYTIVRLVYRLLKEEVWSTYDRFLLTLLIDLVDDLDKRRETLNNYLVNRKEYIDTTLDENGEKVTSEEFFEDIACRIDKIEDCLPVLKEAISLLKEQLYDE